MLSQSSKVFIPLAWVSFVMAIAYGIVTGNNDGVVIYLGLTVVATSAGVFVSGARENEFPARIAADAPPPRLHRVTWAPPVVGGLWTAMGAAAMGLVLCGFVLGPVPTVAGLVVGLAAVVGWGASVSADHTGRTLDLAPLAMPVVGLFTIFCLMFSISRVLLAVPEQASTVVAIAIGVVILSVASFVALGPRLSRGTVLAILAIAGVLLAGGGMVAAAVGARTVEKPEGVAGAPVALEAQGIQFTTKTLTVKADTPAEIKFRNADAPSVPHNVAVYTDPDHTQQVFVGDPVPGGSKIDYRFKAPGPGTYYYRCDIHPSMQGTLTVTP